MTFTQNRRVLKLSTFCRKRVLAIAEVKGAIQMAAVLLVVTVVEDTAPVSSAHRSYALSLTD